jgi:surfeit locus 1 family protein
LRAQTWVLAAAAVGLAVGFALLGQWQLRRAGEAEAAAADFASRALLPALEVLPGTDAASELRYRRVALRGHYLPQAQVLMDNMTRAGVAGYQVLTPFVAAGGVVAVNRGFVPAPPLRSELPEVGVSSDVRTLRGRVETLPEPALRLDTEDAGAGPVRVVSFPDPQDLERAFGRPVAGYQVLLDASEPDGFVRAWEPSGIRAERNLAYAGQWFALSVATLVAGFGLLLRSALRKRGDA